MNGHGTTFIGNSFQGDSVGAMTIVGVTRGLDRKLTAQFSFGGDIPYPGKLTTILRIDALWLFQNTCSRFCDRVRLEHANQVGFGFASFLLGDVTSSPETQLLPACADGGVHVACSAWTAVTTVPSDSRH